MEDITKHENFKMKYPLQVLIFAALNECYDYAFAALSQGQEAEYLGKCSLLPKILNHLFLKYY